MISALAKEVNLASTTCHCAVRADKIIKEILQVGYV